ncbi:MAG: cobyrinic acid a,c-diamide synthase, partial [Acidobacteriota bacterium]
FPVGFRFRGHEFHYSRVRLAGAPPPTACEVKRGTGCYAGRDGILVGGTWAGYTHVHALATPEWASGFLEAAARRRDRPARM